jgi:twitching motility protein PilT
LIRENKTYQIASLIQTGGRQKMQTLDQSLTNLVEKGLVTVEDARSRAKDPGEFDRLMEVVKVEGGMDNGAGGPPNRPTPPPAVGVRGQPNRPGYSRE